MLWDFNKIWLALNVPGVLQAFHECFGSAMNALGVQ